MRKIFDETDKNFNKLLENNGLISFVNHYQNLKKDEKFFNKQLGKILQFAKVQNNENFKQFCERCYNKFDQAKLSNYCLKENLYILKQIANNDNTKGAIDYLKTTSFEELKQMVKRHTARYDKLFKEFKTMFIILENCYNRLKNETKDVTPQPVKPNKPTVFEKLKNLFIRKK